MEMPEDMEDWIKAGKIAATALEYGKNLIKVDASLLEVTEKIENKVFSLNGRFAFPVNLSINETAAHNCAIKEDKTAFKENYLVKLDIGIHVDGYIADNATTVSLNSDKALAEAPRKALNEAIKIIKPGIKVNEIGAVIGETISSLGFKPIRNLGGHLIRQYLVHAEIFIPNFDNKDKTELKEDMVVAIEPFATDGIGLVAEGKASEIYRIVNKKPIRDLNAKRVLDYIDENHKTMPFAKRWLNFQMVEYSLKLLEKEKILHRYPKLIERSNCPVSQAEHTLIVKDNPIITTKVD